MKSILGVQTNLHSKENLTEPAQMLLEVSLPPYCLEKLNFVLQKEPVNSLRVLSFKFPAIHPVVLFHIIQNSQIYPKCEKFLLSIPGIHNENIENLTQKDDLKVFKELQYTSISTEKGFDFLFCSIWPHLSFQRTRDLSSLNHKRCPIEKEIAQFLDSLIKGFQQFNDKALSTKEKLNKIIQGNRTTKKLLKIIKHSPIASYVWILQTIDLDFFMNQKNGCKIVLELLHSKICFEKLLLLVSRNVISICTHKYASQVLLRIFKTIQTKEKAAIECTFLNFLDILLSEIESQLISLIHDPYSLKIIKVIIKSGKDYSKFALKNFDVLIQTKKGIKFMYEFIRNKADEMLEDKILSTYESLIFIKNGEDILFQCCNNTQRYFDIYDNQEQNLQKN